MVDSFPKTSDRPEQADGSRAGPRAARPVRRYTVGMIALALWIGAAASWAFMSDGSARESLLAACVRVGTLMSVIWLAFREIERMPGWILGTFPLVLAVIAVRPRTAYFLIPLILALTALHRMKFGKPR